MSDKFKPISMEELTSWIFRDIEEKNSIFGIPQKHFFVPRENDEFKSILYGHSLDTPFGPAAGPHTQMAQNIIVSWLCGARYMELKTIQTLDELDVSKPCIDMEDEGYNVEWSQELKVHESFEEYLRAWVLIHALHRKLGFPGNNPGTIFNMSVGYNLEGILKSNVQWYLGKMRDATSEVKAKIDIVAAYFPEIKEINIPSQLSNSITLSTMHGCPPDEIEKITSYLMTEWNIHTCVKCNPTLLGPEGTRNILKELQFTDVTVPDVAFEHDLKYEDAVPMLKRLSALADKKNLTFGVKLTNTLEVENHRSVFHKKEKMMYLSGRPLHAISINVARRLNTTFEGNLFMSFSAGIDCFNIADMLRCGMKTITVCTDLLKTGGYLRMLQYIENIKEALEGRSLEMFAGDASTYLEQYAKEITQNIRYKNHSYYTSQTKTKRKLELFDCIEAPCVDECPINQQVPLYMNAVRNGNIQKAIEITRADNPTAAILGRVCDHLCENTCIRTHLDEPLAIRELKRFIMDRERDPFMREQEKSVGKKVAIIGAGPVGFAAGRELAYAGFGVVIFEMHPYAGGMVGGAIPTYRIPRERIDQDLKILEALGVEIKYNQQAGRDFKLSDLRQQGFDYTVIGVGAQLGKCLGLEGEDSEGVMDALHFLRGVRENNPPKLGQRIGIIGAGDTAMDCARSAWRLRKADVRVIYRRTIDQMPADRDEVRLLLEEGIAVDELLKPHRLKVKDGSLEGLVCTRMEFRGDRDKSGRKIPHEIPESEVEIPLDTLILAISQHSILDFFGNENIDVNQWGYIEVNPDTGETSLPGVYAAGDVADDGPSSIVKAVADGKKVAHAIIGKDNNSGCKETETLTDPIDLIRKRARRNYRTSVPHSHLEDRKNFNEVVQTYSMERAVEEADRCLDCHQYCSICTSVCPNLAILTWEMEPFQAELPTYMIQNGKSILKEKLCFNVDQGFQIAILTDFCNECGNCETFCPTAGIPYKDKPRLYLNREEFEAESENAFMIYNAKNAWGILARWDGETHQLEINSKLKYTSPQFSGLINPDKFKIENLTPQKGCKEGATLQLKACATMYVVFNGLKDSVPHVNLNQ